MTYTESFVGFGVLLIAIGAAVAVWAMRGGARRGIEVTAQVVGVRHQEGTEDPIYGGGGEGWAPIVRFHTVDGEVVEATTRSVSASSPRRVPAAGTTLRIRYRRGDPHHAYLRGWGPERYLKYVGVFVGVVFAFVGVLFVVIAFA